MTTYLIFLYGMFDDYEDIEYFCTEVVGEHPVINNLRFVVENSKNLILILDTEATQEELSKELYEVLVNDNVKFYFVFRRDEVITAHLPEQVKDFLFSKQEDQYLRIEYSKPKKEPQSLDLDDVLEKIERDGIDSLTKDEKKFLDNFDNPK
jgi:signal recognition particle receptor subunit beta